MSKLPTIAVRNAIAFVAETGNWPSQIRFQTRWDAERHGVKFNLEATDRFLAGGEYRPYSASDEARAIGAASPLGRCIAWVAERGFRVQCDGFRGRKPKPNFIRIINAETGVEGFISGGERVFLPKDGSRWNSELVFDAAKRRQVKGR